MKHSRANSSGCSENVDRISNLPDALIHQILSCIDMKYVVQTCVLSKRWIYVWTSLPVLHFGYDEETDEEDQMRFVNFVNKVLSLCGNSDIHSFCLSGYYNGAITVGDVCEWVTTAVSRNVQKLVIDIRIDEDFEVPACLCTCKSLTKLNLVVNNRFEKQCKVILPSAMSLPRLKSLHLRDANLSFSDPKLADEFFSNCPSLESLVMLDCGLDGMNLNMSFPNLKCFNLIDYTHENINEVKLYAPSLTSFCLCGYMPTSFTLENHSSLVSADMCIWIRSEDRAEGYVPGTVLAEKKEFYTQLMMRCLRCFHNVRVLKLGDSFLEALGGSSDILDSHQPLEFYHLRLLKLSVGLSRDTMRTIFYILKSSPNIESLYLRSEKDSSDTPLYPFCDEVKLNPENIRGLDLPFLIYHIKFIKIKNLGGCLYELKLLAILLKHSLVLEKVVLCSRSTDEELKQKEKQMEKFCEMLLTFPRASTNVMISYSVSAASS